MALSKNETYTVTIQGYSSDGLGVARIDVHVVFVQGALDGENCEIKILRVEKQVAYAKILELITPSPYRREPACPIFGKCGGCDLMHMHYTEELRMKRQRVQYAVERIGGLDLQVSQIIAAEETTHYRNKAIYAVGEGPVTGFFRSRSHEIIPAEGCLIQNEAADRAAEALKEWMTEYGIPAYDEKLDRGLVRHLFVRHATYTGQTAVCVVVRRKKFKYQEALVEIILRHCPEALSVVLCVNKSRGNTVLQGDFITLWGADQIQDSLGGFDFRLSPRSFFQVNREQAERLYHKAVAYAGLSGWETVLDLYCGTGTITFCLARRAQTAIGVEIVRAAIQDARENAHQNGVTNTRFICADAGTAAKTLEREGITPEVVVVDPPRKGLAPDVIETIAAMGPDRVVYISCDPATMARDLKRFGEREYSTKEITPLDMFPRCAHVECVALIESDTASRVGYC